MEDVARTMLDRLNRGERVVTYQMVQVPPQNRPITGEVRWLQPMIPSPADPLAAVVPLMPAGIIWDGAEWKPVNRLRLVE